MTGSDAPELVQAMVWLLFIVQRSVTTAVALDATKIPSDDIPEKPMAPVVVLTEIGEDAPALIAKVPVVFGRVSVGVPAVACAITLAVPLVAPVKPIIPPAGSVLVTLLAFHNQV